jgi:hypothetical protein
MIREVKTHKSSIELLEYLMKTVRRLFDQAVSGQISEARATDESRRLQDEIYVHRMTNQPIFDWVYNLLRKTISENTGKTMDDIVNEALEKKQTDQHQGGNS